MRTIIAPSLVIVALGAGAGADPGPSAPERTHEILVTSEAGDRLAVRENVRFARGEDPGGTAIVVRPDRLKQTIDGIGSSFTESSAFVLAHLVPSVRRSVMEELFGEEGADFTLTRTHIGSCDFTVEGKYSYAAEPGDADLDSFTIAPDLEGFDPSRYPGVKDPDYDLLPMIREALEIKRAQGDDGLRIVASAWTAPPWMKDTEAWYIPGSPENDWQGEAGSLKPQYVPVYADYLARYLDAYEREGVDVWGLTPVNEPHGNGGNWESMYFTPHSQNEFVHEHLVPTLREAGHDDVRLLVYDQNRDGLEEWTDVIFADPRSRGTVYGVAIHWYASTFKVFEDVLQRVHEEFPEFAIMHTEGCIDNLGNPAPRGIEDPEGFQEEGWFGNDAFWWNTTATDWAYTATWAPNADDHPMYTPVHRYARNIIVSLDHWVTGWIDWNVVLDRHGGPNHADNHCGAPIMIDTETGEIYRTPIYHVLAQFSRTIRPGDRAVETERRLGDLGPDDLHACATINDDGLLSVQMLNTTKRPIPLHLRIGDAAAPITAPANSVQTVRIQLR